MTRPSMPVEGSGVWLGWGVGVPGVLGVGLLGGGPSTCAATSLQRLPSFSSFEPVEHFQWFWSRDASESRPWFRTCELLVSVFAPCEHTCEQPATRTVTESQPPFVDGTVTARSSSVLITCHSQPVRSWGACEDDVVVLEVITFPVEVDDESESWRVGQACARPVASKHSNPIPESHRRLHPARRPNVTYIRKHHEVLKTLSDTMRRITREILGFNNSDIGGSMLPT
jgi:hypothetical protein